MKAQVGDLKAAIHAAAMEKQRQQLPRTSTTITHLHPASDQAKCCTVMQWLRWRLAADVPQVAMFLGTMNLPQNGDTLDLGDKALACCREKLCPKFKSKQDCTWISSGDLSWKQKLSDDLDRVQVGCRWVINSFRLV